jgi:hypothetical protein
VTISTWSIFLNMIHPPQDGEERCFEALDTPAYWGRGGVSTGCISNHGIQGMRVVQNISI